MLTEIIKLWPLMAIPFISLIDVIKLPQTKKNVDKKCHSSSTRNLNMLYSVKYVSPYKAAINISFSF